MLAGPTLVVVVAIVVVVAVAMIVVVVGYSKRELPLKVSIQRGPICMARSHVFGIEVSGRVKSTLLDKFSSDWVDCNWVH